MKLSYGSLFSDMPEQSGRLRLLTLAMAWWAGLALGTVGGAVWVWLGGSLVATAGHAFSWYTRSKRLRIWVPLLLVPIVGITVLIASSLPPAFDGNWLPAIHYLLLLQAVASFHLRTRSSLYTGQVLSATVLVLASQLAFDSSFLVFMAGFFVLVLVFLAMATTADATRDVLARAPWRGLARMAAWTGLGGGVLALGVLLFLLLPSGALQGSAAPTASVLPLTGESLPSGPVGQGTASPTGAPEAPGHEPGGAQAPASSPPGGEASPETAELDLQPSADVDDSSLPATLGEQGRPAASRSPEAGSTLLPTTPGSPDASSAPPVSQGEEVVMQVRSPVASYWRGLTYPFFDGRRWLWDSTVRLEHGSAGGVVSRYTQTYYLRKAQPAPVLGYSAVDWRRLNGSSSAGGLEEGTIYQVVSQRRIFQPDVLRFAGRFVRPQEALAANVPPRVRALADQIVGETANPLDRALLITQYLRRNYTYVPSAEGVASPQPVEQFLFGEERSGSAFDFASAQALLARGAGLSARVVTGYLPGEFDPLSGTYIVRRRDTHAWAEIRFPGVGWVPFDASPRPDLPDFASTRGGLSGAMNRVFQWRLGDDIRSALDTSVAALKERAKGFLFSPKALFAVGLIAGVIALWLRRRRRGLEPAWRYTRLPGRERRSLLKAQRRLEAYLRRHGVSPRRPAETLSGYFGRVAAVAPQLQEDMEWLRDAFTEAAYGPTPPTSEGAASALRRLSRVRAILRTPGST